MGERRAGANNLIRRQGHAGRLHRGCGHDPLHPSREAQTAYGLVRSTNIIMCINHHLVPRGVARFPRGVSILRVVVVCRPELGSASAKAALLDAVLVYADVQQVVAGYCYGAHVCHNEPPQGRGALLCAYKV